MLSWSQRAWAVVFASCWLAGCAAQPRVSSPSQPIAVDLNDPDLDGVRGAADHCPLVAEDRDGVADEDGCPEVDQDCDGIEDSRDRCPTQAEDLDGFEDEDGCEDPDNDDDRIEDRCDQCPNEPETYQGIDDEDGCPDRSHVVVSHQDIVIMERVFFQRNRVTPFERSIPVLQAIAQVMAQHVEIRRVAVVGHSSGDERNAQALSLRRANSARDWLIAHGVDAARLEAVGRGSTQPVVIENSHADRERNRNVEFSLREQTQPPEAPPRAPRPVTLCPPATPRPSVPGGCPLPDPRPGGTSEPSGPR